MVPMAPQSAARREVDHRGGRARKNRSAGLSQEQHTGLSALAGAFLYLFCLGPADGRRPHSGGLPLSPCVSLVP